MKANEIKVGCEYKAKVGDKVTTVRVLGIRTRAGYGRTHDRTVYDVLNLTTNRNTTFKSAAKFRGPARVPPMPADRAKRVGSEGGENGLPPTAPSATTPASNRVTRPGKPTAVLAAGATHGGSGPVTIGVSDRLVARTVVVKNGDEYQVMAYAADGSRITQADYFTADKDDAVVTAKQMVRVDADGRRIVRDCYFKDYGDHGHFMSGLPIPTDADNVCRNVRFENCDFHPGCRVKTENVVYDGCSGTADNGFKYDEKPQRDVPYDLAVVEQHSAGPCTCSDCTAYRAAHAGMMDGPGDEG